MQRLSRLLLAVTMLLGIATAAMAANPPAEPSTVPVPTAQEFSKDNPFYFGAGSEDVQAAIKDLRDQGIDLKKVVRDAGKAANMSFYFVVEPATSGKVLDGGTIMPFAQYVSTHTGMNWNGKTPGRSLTVTLVRGKTNTAGWQWDLYVGSDFEHTILNGQKMNGEYFIGDINNAYSSGRPSVTDAIKYAVQMVSDHVVREEKIAADAKASAEASAFFWGTELPIGIAVAVMLIIYGMQFLLLRRVRKIRGNAQALSQNLDDLDRGYNKLTTGQAAWLEKLKGKTLLDYHAALEIYGEIAVFNVALRTLANRLEGAIRWGWIPFNVITYGWVLYTLNSRKIVVFGSDIPADKRGAFDGDKQRFEFTPGQLQASIAAKVEALKAALEPISKAVDNAGQLRQISFKELDALLASLPEHGIDAGTFKSEREALETEKATFEAHINSDPLGAKEDADRVVTKASELKGTVEATIAGKQYIEVNRGRVASLAADASHLATEAAATIASLHEHFADSSFHAEQEAWTQTDAAIKGSATTLQQVEADYADKNFIAGAEKLLQVITLLEGAGRVVKNLHDAIDDLEHWHQDDIKSLGVLGQAIKSAESVVGQPHSGQQAPGLLAQARAEFEDLSKHTEGREDWKEFKRRLETATGLARQAGQAASASIAAFGQAQRTLAEARGYVQSFLTKSYAKQAVIYGRVYTFDYRVTPRLDRANQLLSEAQTDLDNDRFDAANQAIEAARDAANKADQALVGWVSEQIYNQLGQYGYQRPYGDYDQSYYPTGYAGNPVVVGPNGGQIAVDVMLGELLAQQQAAAAAAEEEERRRRRDQGVPAGPDGGWTQPGGGWTQPGGGVPAGGDSREPDRQAGGGDIDIGGGGGVTSTPEPERQAGGGDQDLG